MDNSNRKMNEVQTCILDIFKAIAQVCKKHDLKYFAVFGTMIGVVRHQGFIPWDDDLDIGMPIDDLLRFVVIAENELPEYYRIHSPMNIKHFSGSFIKVVDTRTTFVEVERDRKFKDAYKGVFVDIFPYIGVPDNRQNIKVLYSKLRFYRSLNFIRRFPISEMKSRKAKLVWIITKPICTLFPFNFFLKRSLLLYRKYSISRAKEVGCVFFKNAEKYIWPKEWISKENLVEMDFEDTRIPCSKFYDSWLRSMKIYGDYTVIPPEEKRKVHVPYILDLNRSYKELE